MFSKIRSRSRIKRGRIRDRKHLAKVAALGCIICGSAPQIHHIRHKMGMAQRNDDYHAIPICYLHHQGRLGIHHLGTRRWEALFGAEEDLLEKTLKALKS